MQASRNNNSTKSTPESPLSIKIEEQENGETWVSITPRPQLAPPPPPPRMTTPRPPTPKTAQEGWETTVALPTSPPYRAPQEWEAAGTKEQARREYDVLSWTACYDDGCQVHYRDKEASGWFPQDRSRSMPSGPVSHRNKKQQRKRHGQSVTWYECYDDKCFVHVQEKIKAGYYLQENGERKPVSKWHRRHTEPEQRRKFAAVRTRQEGEGSAKTQPDVGALQRQIQELLGEKQQTLERYEKTRQELVNYQTTIGRMCEEIKGLRRTVAGSGFSLARLRNEYDAKKRANEELEHRNHSRPKELRKAGQRWLDLGE